MDKISQMPCLILLATAVLMVCVLSHELRCWRQRRCLEQQRTQQRLRELIEAELHNGPLQQLAFLIRELQLHHLSQRELIQHLRDVYQDVQAALSTDKLN